MAAFRYASATQCQQIYGQTDGRLAENRPPKGTKLHGAKEVAFESPTAYLIDRLSAAKK